MTLSDYGRSKIILKGLRPFWPILDESMCESNHFKAILIDLNRIFPILGDSGRSLVISANLRRL